MLLLAVFNAFENGKNWNRSKRKLRIITAELEERRKRGNSIEMEDCLGDNASVKPVFTFETSGGSSSSSSRPSTPSHFNSESDSDGDETEDGCSSQKDLQKKRLKRKRKWRSSASEMIEFLKDYSEKREKVEEEKVNILKVMHEEKKQFLQSIFQLP